MKGGAKYYAGPYEVEDIGDARQLAQAVANRTRQTVHLMEKLDEMTPAYALEAFNPEPEERRWTP